MRTDTATCVLFLAAILAPTADFLLRPAEARSVRVENKNPAPAPKLTRSLDSFMRFPEHFGAWFNDQFGLRDVLVREHNALLLLGLGVEPTSTVLLGQDRWLFFTGDRSPAIWRGIDPLREDELETWRTALEERRAWLAKLGIEYLFVFVPNKEQIYPERMPARLNRLGPTRLDQIMEYLRARSTLVPLDLRAALSAEREHDQGDDHSYFPLGSHWTDRGAWAAVNAIIERLQNAFPALQTFDRAHYRREPQPGETYDSWGKMLRMDDLLPQTWWRFVPVEGLRSREIFSDVHEGAVGKVITELADPGLPRALLLHDSFGPFLRPFLSERCSRLISLWSYTFPKELIWSERPQVVIQMYTERSLAWGPWPSTREAAAIDAHAFEFLAPVLAPVDFSVDLGGFVPFAGTRIVPAAETDGGGLAIETTSEGAMVYFPAFEAPEDAFTVLHLDVTSPSATAMEIMYTTRASPAHDRQKHLQAFLQAGRNDLYFDLPVKGIAGTLLVRPGAEPGRYVIHRIEARARREHAGG